MICLLWNIRGIENNSSRAALKKLILKNKPDFVFLAGPWMNFNNFPPNWLSRLHLKQFAFNNRDSLLLNIWCFCNDSINPIILNSDDQQVSFTVNTHGMEFGFSVIYASTNYVNRRNLWLTLSIANPNTP